MSRSLFFIVGASGSNLSDIAEPIEAAKVSPVIDSVWPLEQFAEAFKKLDLGHAKGKIVVKVGQ